MLLLIVNHEKPGNGSGLSDSDLPRCSPYLVRGPIHASDLSIVTPAAPHRGSKQGLNLCKLSLTPNTAGSNKVAVTSLI